MDKIALLFAGQGSQYPGMGKDFYDTIPAAKTIFDTLEQYRPGTKQQCFEGSKELLAETIYTQPCMFAVDYIIAKTVEERLRVSGSAVSAVAGFSLGEIPALAFAELLELPQAFDLVCYRAQVMQQAAEQNPGSMMAILKLKAEQIAALAAEYTDVFPVNYNSPEQTAVAGNQEQLKAFAEAVKAAGGRVVPLAVSGAFHSPYMNAAAEALHNYADVLQVQVGKCPVYANQTAQLYTAQTAKELLSNQVNHPVQWVATIEQMIADGINCFIEVGPGKTLSGLVKKINAAVQIHKIENTADLLALEQWLDGGNE